MAFTFIDLFCGMGGFHQAGKDNGGKCLFSSDINKHAQQVYELNYNCKVHGDITKIKSTNIPDFDLMCAGFPCQAFSTAGKKQGFSDKRGILIFDVLRIIREKQPKAFILENVQGLLSHDSGKTFSIILDLLGKTVNRKKKFFNMYQSDCINYNVFYTVLNSGNYGLAQNRKRVYIIGFRQDIKSGQFTFPGTTDNKKCIKHITENIVDKDLFLEQSHYQFLIKRHIKAISKGARAFGDLRLKSNIDKASTITVTNIRGKERSENVLIDKATSKDNVINSDFERFLKRYKPKNYELLLEKKSLRRFTIKECLRLQGYPDSFNFGEVSKSQQYNLIGNTVTPPTVSAILKQILKIIN